MDQQDTITAQIAVKKGFLSKEQLTDCETLLSSAEDEKHLMEVALAKGYLTQFQSAQIIKEAEKHAQRQDPIPGFKLVSELGKGGMGKVYKARQISLNREVAIKVLPANLAKNPGYIERFQREARSAGQLVHPNVVQVIQIGETAQKHHFIVMEYVDGPTVHTLMKKSKRLPEQEAIEIIRQVTLALREAHRLNLIHRDIKPANIILNRDGVTKLADFGLAREEEDNSVTRTGALMGTPHYMSPEQARGQKDLDIRSDIYSLGATLYHMVVGQVPFIGDNATATILKHIEEAPVPPKERNPEISEGLNAVILKALSKKREDRFESPEALLHAFEDLDSAASTLATISNVAPAAKAIKEQPSPVAPGSNAPTAAPSLSDEPTLTAVKAPGASKMKMLFAAAAGCFCMLVLMAIVFDEDESPVPDGPVKVEPATPTTTPPANTRTNEGNGPDKTAKVQKTDTAPTVPPEDVAPPDPPSRKKRIDELFHGKVGGYLPKQRLVRVKYDFESSDQMKDWKVFSRTDRKNRELFFVQGGNLNLRAGTIMAHKAIFEREVVLEVELKYVPATTFVIGGKDDGVKDKTEIMAGWSNRPNHTVGFVRIGTKVHNFNVSPPAKGHPISFSILVNDRNMEVNFDGKAHTFSQIPTLTDTRGHIGIIAPTPKLKDFRPFKNRFKGMWTLEIQSIFIKGALTEEYLEHAIGN